MVLVLSRDGRDTIRKEGSYEKQGSLLNLDQIESVVKNGEGASHEGQRNGVIMKVEAMMLKSMAHVMELRVADALEDRFVLMDEEVMDVVLFHYGSILVAGDLGQRLVKSVLLNSAGSTSNVGKLGF
ncbi:hypothetical protein VNO78_11207 [Psophocarpus tetragonolobus]|uniref:Uncharacterized protein n=1 Tax=Psophocarpus tetragonolobus TaxID=3891 RepID=A0AAN9ST72_PSOTE